MISKRKNRFKPLYKQFINLNENVQNRKKILQFKKQKWIKLVSLVKKKLKRYKKFKPQNQTQYVVSRYPNKWNSYKKGKYRNILQIYKKFKLFYGNFTRQKIKKFIKQSLNINNKINNTNLIFLKIFESRLDTILYRAKFSKSIRESRQLIVHGKILVNNKKIHSQCYFAKSGDLITIKFNDSWVIEKNIANAIIWPIPPKHLVINYKTLQIIVGTIDNNNLSSYFHFNFNLEKLLVDYYKIF
jgi:small subunit ribosomal protein S4